MRRDEWSIQFIFPQGIKTINLNDVNIIPDLGERVAIGGEMLYVKERVYNFDSREVGIYLEREGIWEV